MANCTIMASNDDFSSAFNFKWKIKNFSQCLPNEIIKSPVFTVESMDKTRWCLQLLSKNYPDGTHLEFYLGREADKNEPGPIRVNFELSFLDSYDIQLVKKVKEASFQKGDSKGFAEFLEQSVVYIQRTFEYLPEDILTACCRMKRIGGLPQKPVFCSAHTVIGIEQSSFYWYLKDFSRIRPGMLRVTRKRNPYVRVELSLTSKPEEALQFDVSHAHVHKPNMTNCEISLINAFEDVAYSKRDSKYLEGEVWKFPIFLKKSHLAAEKNVYLKDDILVLKFDISVSLGVTSSVIDYYRSPTLEDEIIDYSPSKHETDSEVKQETDILMKVIKEFERKKEMKMKKIETLEKVLKKIKNARETKLKENEAFRMPVRAVWNVEEIKTKGLGTVKETLKGTNNIERMKIKRTGSFRKTKKEMQNVRETKDKKMFGEFSHKNPSTSMKKNSSPAQFGISYSNVYGTVVRSDNYRLKPSFEDEVSSSTESETILEIREDIDTLKKAIKELEKVEKMKIKEIETLERPMEKAMNVKEMSRKEFEENISHDVSSSFLNETSTPDQNNRSYSIDSDSMSELNNEKYLLKTSFQDVASTSSANDGNSSNEYERKIMQEIDDLKKALKEMEETEEMTIKEIETLKKTHKALDKVEEMQIKEIESLRKAIKEMISSSTEE